MEFYEEFLKIIFSAVSNNYADNWDYLRFGDKPAPFNNKFKNRINSYLNKKGYYTQFNVWEIDKQIDNARKFKYLFDNLEYDNDRKLLLQVLAYRILGHTKVKLPLNTPEYWERMKSIEDLAVKTDSINPNFLHLTLNRINLKPIGYPIDFYFTIGGVMTDFIVKQYEYEKNGILIKAEKEDIVIDGGGCWGDTALYFSNEVGSRGKVFSFEFIPNNIKIFDKNISLNQQLKENIELVKHPLWHDSATSLYYKDFGPGSKVSLEPFEGKDGDCTTLTIDDLIRQKQLSRLDFIKLDIEGAETNALEGAMQSIIKFKPKLAIALYHSPDDFDRIPHMIKKMVPEYEFYFSHCTMNSEESILFAKAN